MAGGMDNEDNVWRRRQWTMVRWQQKTAGMEWKPGVAVAAVDVSDDNLTTVIMTTMMTITMAATTSTRQQQQQSRPWKGGHYIDTAGKGGNKR
jgi:hypothetical protein